MSVVEVRCVPQGRTPCIWSGWPALALMIATAFAIGSLSVSSAQTQPSFISYACGAPKRFTANGISWASDAPVAPGGETLTAKDTNFRFFSTYNSSNPQQNTNCYDKVSAMSSEGPVLFRVTYQYLNYDSLNSPPKFDMWVGTTKVATIDLTQRDPWTEEVIYDGALSSDARVFCLVALEGAPVLSYIELRPLPASSYKANDTTMLRQIYRLDCGNTNLSVRYPDDPYDRVWDVDQSASSNTRTFTSNAIIDDTQVSERPPSVVLQTSRALSRGTSLLYDLKVKEAGEYRVKVYFVDLIGSNSPTTFNVLVNENAPALVILNGLTVQEQDYAVSTNSKISITLQQQINNPEISALEVFKVISTGSVSPSGDSLNSIKAYYGLDQLDWVRDPCLPTPWKGVSCNDSIITSLDLSNLELVRFSNLFADLTGLTYLNLSNNRLSSAIPDLSPLSALQILDLRNNDLFGTLNMLIVLAASLRELDVSNNKRLSGIIPYSLNHSGLVVDTKGTCIGQDASCLREPLPIGGRSSGSPQRKSGWINPLIGGIVAAAVTVVVGVGFFYFCSYKNKSPASTASFTEKGSESDRWDTELNYWTSGKKFPYKELATATNHFKEPLGRGCFGTVYFGKLANKQEVAVKMRSDASQLGADSFKNEVFLLSRIYHPNLVSLLGYCQDRRHQLLVYEYMAGGTLSDHLYEVCTIYRQWEGFKWPPFSVKGSRARLNWVDRLHIAIGSARGIAYLHNESDPKIIHRDVKSNNILLDKSMSAKVSDFGLSKLVVATEATHVTTIVKGTAGYLDPEYYTTQQLTEKSDVYSFGVVLLELISGREPLNASRDPREYNLISWAKPHLLAGSCSAIVDTAMTNSFKQKSVDMVAGLALHCIQKRGAERPSMLQVLRVLEDALALEGQRSHSPSFKFKRVKFASPRDAPTIPLTLSR